MPDLPLIRIKSCPKLYRQDLDKAISPVETCQRLAKILSRTGMDIVSEIRRIDSGRLGIPVYLSICGSDARAIMPTRKQMGKGSSPEQAQASALMELMERFSFFSFWNRTENFKKTSWDEAKKIFGADLIPLEDILLSVHDDMSHTTAERLLNLLDWSFYPATRLNDEQTVWLPLDWFRLLGEFNGSSAGNSPEESLIQGMGELIERHVSCIADREKGALPTISQKACTDPKLNELLDSFRKNKISLILKDMSLGIPVPTVAALAWDPSTFPESSEIVFTAGTASSPAKAAIRAVTEVAQLAGDFHTNSCYEASGLSKYSSLEECAWILQGPETTFAQMPSIEDNDLQVEIRNCVGGLAPLHVYAVDISHPRLRIPAHYCMIPGLEFRERAKNQSLGLFVGRKLAEEKPYKDAMTGLDKLERIVPQAAYLPFFRGLSSLNNGFVKESLAFFKSAIPLQKDEESLALAEFYSAFALSKNDAWQEAGALLESAISHCADVKEYHNLLGVAHYKTGEYAKAEEAFSRALKLDKGSAMDLANRGICRKLQGKRQEAIEDLQAAFGLDPSLDFAASHLHELDRS